jgi:hypothetical protein
MEEGLSAEGGAGIAWQRSSSLATLTAGVKADRGPRWHVAKQAGWREWSAAEMAGFGAPRVAEEMAG